MTKGIQGFGFDIGIFDQTKEKIDKVLNNGELLIIVPPFYNIGFIALGPYILQAIAKAKGFKVDILHLDLLLANLIGIDEYIEIQESPTFWMLGERMFARSAYDMPALGKDSELMDNHFHNVTDSNKANVELNQNLKPNLPLYQQCEDVCYHLVKQAVDVISSKQYKAIGVSLGFCNQLNATVALVNEVKKQTPDCVTLIGGSYCEGEKAEALFSLSNHIDYIFEGESELTFIDFLQHLRENKPYPKRLIKPDKEVPLSTLPIADYEAYAKQVIAIMGEEYYQNRVKAVWYETNRGCWWAEKAKCTFCGITEIGFRQKSIASIAQDLEAIKKQAPDKLVFFTDLIMSSGFPKKLLDHDSEAVANYPALGMQLKVTRTVKEMAALGTIKTKYMLPGIESFTTSLLKKMKKGTTGKQNIYFVRNAYCFGISNQYYLLWGFPQDELREYELLRDIIPLMVHLQPPEGFNVAQISRDAPLFTNHKEFNIKSLSYWKVYDMIFPKHANISQVANYFTGDFESQIYENIDLVSDIYERVQNWKSKWREVNLNMISIMGNYMVTDTREIVQEGTATYLLNESDAREVMLYQMYKDNPVLEWAIDKKLGLLLDGWYVPLVTAAPELLLKFEEEYQTQQLFS